MTELLKDVAFISAGGVGGKFLSKTLKEKVSFLADKPMVVDAVLVGLGVFLAYKFPKWDKVGYGIAVAGMNGIFESILDKFM